MIQRNYKIDNIKGILIFLVVLGHILELNLSSLNLKALFIIYSFHMPMFMCITGFYAKFSVNKLLKNYVIPYIVCQAIYTVCYNLLGFDETISYRLFTPHWAYWYIYVCIIYIIGIKLFPNDTIYRICSLFISIFLALLAGYIQQIEYTYSLSRLICFLPFFMLGYYLGNPTSKNYLLKCKKILDNKFLKIGIGLIAVMAIAYLTYTLRYSSVKILYYAKSYSEYGIDVTFRVRTMLLNFIWMIVVYLATPSKKLPILSNIGQNTFTLYLLHGIIVIIIKKMDIFYSYSIENTVVALILAIATILGNKTVNKWGKYLLTGVWAVDIISKIKASRKEV